MWSKARCLAALDGRLPDAVTVEVVFKKPVLLPGTVLFGSARSDDGYAFALSRPAGREAAPARPVRACEASEHGRLPHHVPAGPGVPALRVARHRGADRAAALRRARPGDVRRGPRPERADRDRLLRAAQPARGRRRAVRRRRRRRGAAAGGRPRPRGVHRIRSADERLRRRARRDAAALRGAPGRIDLLPGSEHRRLRLPVPGRGQRQPARRARHPRAGARLRRAGDRRPVVRHDGALRAAGRVVPGRHHDARRTPGRRQLPADRHQDVDLRGRPRAGREHRPPRARQDSRARPRASRASRCSSCRSTSSRTTAPSASATTSRWSG